MEIALQVFALLGLAWFACAIVVGTYQGWRLGGASRRSGRIAGTISGGTVYHCEARCAVVPLQAPGGLGQALRHGVDHTEAHVIDLPEVAQMQAEGWIPVALAMRGGDAVVLCTRRRLEPRVDREEG